MPATCDRRACVSGAAGLGGLLDWILEGEDDDRFGSPKPGQDPVRAHRG